MKKIVWILGTLMSINEVVGGPDTYNQSIVQRNQPVIRKHTSCDNSTSEIMIPSKITFFFDRPYIEEMKTWKGLCNELNKESQKILDSWVRCVAKCWVDNEMKKNRYVNPIVGIFQRIFNFKVYVVGEVVRKNQENGKIFLKFYNYFSGFLPEDDDNSNDSDDIGVIF